MGLHRYAWRRLDVPGASAEITATWVHFPALTVEAGHRLTRQRIQVQAEACLPEPPPEQAFEEVSSRYMDPSSQIVEARKAAGLTQAALARRSGTTQSAINRYERGQVRPRAATLQRILRSSQRRRPSEILAERREEVLAFARERGLTDVRVFGSVARGDDDSDSDVDLLVDIPPTYTWFGRVGLQLDLSDLLGVPVDLGSESELDARIKERVLAEARPL